MRRLITFCSVVSLLIMFSGCATTGQVNELTDSTKLFMSKVDKYQTIAMDAFDLAKRDNFISEKTYATVVDFSNDVNNMKPQLSKIVKAVDEAPDNAASKTRAGLEAASPLIPPPYNTLLLLGVGIWEAVTLKRKRDSDIALVKESGKRRSEKAGTEKTIRTLATMESANITADVVKDLLFENIGVERSRNGLT